MTTKNSNQGFAHPGMLIAIVLVVAVVGFGGWYVWQKNKDDKQANGSNNTGQQTNGTDGETPSQPLDETANWVSVTTQGGAFSMKAPDGWKITKYPRDFLGTTSVTYTPGTRAIVETSNSDYAGHDLRFRASITALDDAGLGPQWESPQPGLQESTENFSIGTLQGKRYKGVFTEDLNQTLYEYVFDVGNGKKLDIVYTVDHGEGHADDVTTVEKAIKTIQVN
jgi:hypothetical protein